jgi:hypothetical protein
MEAGAALGEFDPHPTKMLVLKPRVAHAKADRDNRVIEMLSPLRWEFHCIIIRHKFLNLPRKSFQKSEIDQNLFTLFSAI